MGNFKDFARTRVSHFRSGCRGAPRDPGPGFGPLAQARLRIRPVRGPLRRPVCRTRLQNPAPLHAPRPLRASTHSVLHGSFRKGALSGQGGEGSIHNSALYRVSLSWQEGTFLDFALSGSGATPGYRAPFLSSALSKASERAHCRIWPWVREGVPGTPLSRTAHPHTWRAGRSRQRIRTGPRNLSRLDGGRGGRRARRGRRRRQWAVPPRRRRRPARWRGSPGSP